MNEYHISCDICRDLIPLVKDGVASADSEAAVRRHIGECKDCALLLDGKIVPELPASESPKALLRVKRRLSGIYAAVMLLGLCFGLTLTSGVDMFFNWLIMPVVGVFGYLIFRWRAIYAVPIIVVIMQVIITLFGLVKGEWNIDFLMLIIYILLALAGVIAALLLHYAFGKNTKGIGEEK